jgi:asparagine synthase (glutamine-hydrolysing)
MCGIAGFFSNTPQPSELLLRMARLMKHRGPDGEGYVLFNGLQTQAAASPQTSDDCVGARFDWLPKSKTWPVETITGGFAHVRLAVIAPDVNGHQPMCYNNRYWITYNGELYNYLELRSELKLRGYRFQTQSDTEVILAAYAQWGKECLQRFNGMWAFAIYDTLTHNVFAARDRTGVKPFYYTYGNKGFAFASEHKVLLGSGWASKALNPKAVFDYLVFNELEYEAQSIFSNIYELPAGCLLNVSLSGIESAPKISSYYSSSIHETGKEASLLGSELDLIEKTRELLFEAVRLRLRSDITVGSCLSGGIDSSALVGLMRAVLGPSYPIHVFTAVFPGKAADESVFAADVARKHRCIEHLVEPHPNDLAMELETMAYALDLPIWSTSTFAQYSVMKKAREQGIHVLLDGQGGDELFGGYEVHRYFYDRGKNPNSCLLSAFNLRQWMRFSGMFIGGAWLSAKLHRKYYQGLNFIRSDFYESFTDRFEIRAARNWVDLNHRLAWELDNSTLKSYLRCEDRCAMWHSIESRTPFADDPKLISHSFNIPADLKIRDSQSKYILREAVRPYLPASVYKRSDKKGYTTPNNEWIRAMAPQLKEYILSAPFNEYADLPLLEKEYDSFFMPQNDGDNGRIFKWISFAAWLHAFNKLEPMPV